MNQEQRLQAVQTLVALAGHVGSGSSDDLEGWLGPAPADPVALELRSLRQRLELRRQLLSRTISADEMAELLQTRSRQTPHDRAKAERCWRSVTTGVCAFLSASSILRGSMAWFQAWLRFSLCSMCRPWPERPGWIGPTPLLLVQHRSNGYKQAIWLTWGRLAAAWAMARIDLLPL